MAPRWADLRTRHRRLLRTRCPERGRFPRSSSATILAGSYYVRSDLHAVLSGRQSGDAWSASAPGSLVAGTQLSKLHACRGDLGSFAATAQAELHDTGVCTTPPLARARHRTTGHVSPGARTCARRTPHPALCDNRRRADRILHTSGRCADRPLWQCRSGAGHYGPVFPPWADTAGPDLGIEVFEAPSAFSVRSVCSKRLARKTYVLMATRLQPCQAGSNVVSGKRREHTQHDTCTDDSNGT